MANQNLKALAGRHYDTFEAYFRMADVKGTGVIEAGDAVKFLRKSGLSDVVLSRIWELSDSKDTGQLDKQGLFSALKFISLAQMGEQVSVANLKMELANPPKCGDIPKKVWDSLNSINCIPVGTVDWSMNPTERQKYEKIFESLGPEGGFISGNKVRGKLMESKLPIAILGRIWDLADMDKDGSLDKHEFLVAWHLVCVALERKIVPETLPPQLARPQTDEFVAVFPDRISPPPAIPPLPSAAAVKRVSIPSLIDIGNGGAIPPLIPPAPAVAAVAPPGDWVVSTIQKLRYDEVFEKSDRDRDGLVSGLEIKDVFLQSGLPNNILADIWGLCDTNSCGKLTKEQFALAMWMVERKRKENIDPPKSLAPNMVPPSLRPKIAPPLGGIPMPAAQPLIPDDPPQPTYSNPELQMISEDIAKLAKERRQLELEVAQKEADIKIKSGEVRSLESELTTLTATLKQLEYQKGEAQKRLDDLKGQVDKIREQCQNQEKVLLETEGEVHSKRTELQKLKEEEATLHKDFEASQREMEELSRNLQDTQLEISQVKAMVTQLEETKRQMSDSLEACKTAIEANDPNQVSDYALNLEPELRDAKRLLEDKPKEPEKKTTNGFTNRFDTDFSNGFSSGDAFGSKKFEDSFGSPAFNSKPDPFAPAAVDPFAPKPGTTAEAAADAFGSDPFAMLHAPTTAAQAAALTPSPVGRAPPSRPESPSPALPPKKAKQPPMRPPPPRPAAGPTVTKSPAANDAFGDSFSGGGGFANFADFDNKKIVAPVNTLSAVRPAPTPTQQPVTTPANDFSDDPFKNYRYEDVFNIEDPFAEDSSDIKDTFVKDWVNSASPTADPSPEKKADFNDAFPPAFGKFDDAFSAPADFDDAFAAPNAKDYVTFAHGKNVLKKNKFSNFEKSFESATKFNTYKPSKTSMSTAFGDPFGDTKSNNNNNNGFGTAFDDDFNDNFGTMTLSTSPKVAPKIPNFATFDENDNAKSLTVGAKGRGNQVYQKFEASFKDADLRTISKQDYSQDDNFGEVLAQVLERSKLEK